MSGRGTGGYGSVARAGRVPLECPGRRDRRRTAVDGRAGPMPDMSGRRRNLVVLATVPPRGARPGVVRSGPIEWLAPRMAHSGRTGRSERPDCRDGHTRRSSPSGVRRGCPRPRPAAPRDNAADPRPPAHRRRTPRAPTQARGPGIGRRRCAAVPTARARRDDRRDLPGRPQPATGAVPRRPDTRPPSRPGAAGRVAAAPVRAGRPAVRCRRPALGRPARRCARWRRRPTRAALRARPRRSARRPGPRGPARSVR